MTDGNIYAINKHLDDQEAWGELQERYAELDQAEAEAKKYHDAWLEAEAKIVELEAKLARAVETLEFYHEQVKNFATSQYDSADLAEELLDRDGGALARTTIAELKGQDDE